MKYGVLFALLLSTTAARAASWPLSLVNFYANAEFNPAAGTVEFYNGASLAAQQYQASGAFSVLNMPAVTMTWSNPWVDIPYAGLQGTSFTFTDGATLGSFSFDHPISIDINTPSHIVLSALGTLSMTGYDPVLAIWAVDAVPVNAAYGWWPQIGFVAQSPTPVPLPAAAWLFLSGLLGLGVMRWRRVMP